MASNGTGVEVEQEIVMENPVEQERKSDLLHGSEVEVMYSFTAVEVLAAVYSTYQYG